MWMREARRLAADRGHTSDCGVIERVAQCEAADHSGRTDDDQPPLGTGRSHDSERSSTQSTYSRRSENSHAPSVFTNVSL
jgi:hypothetical protein